MDGNDFGQLAYLVLLGVAIGGWFMAESRNSMGKTLRMAMIWVFIFLGVVAGFGLWPNVRDQLMPRQAVFSEDMTIAVPQSPDGHYYLTLALDGTPVEFVIDTGATSIVLTKDDAEKIGLAPETLIYSGIANTANGEVRTATARVRNVDIGPINDRDVRVAVNDGEMDTSLLGMDYLRLFNRLEISNGRLILER
jgi:aspartyl protease family protein